jgi:hypothetical protein
MGAPVPRKPGDQEGEPGIGHAGDIRGRRVAETSGGRLMFSGYYAVREMDPYESLDLDLDLAHALLVLLID